MRLFFALPVPREAQERLGPIVERARRAGGEGVSFTRNEQLHFTLAFLVGPGLLAEEGQREVELLVPGEAAQARRGAGGRRGASRHEAVRAVALRRRGLSQHGPAARALAWRQGRRSGADGGGGAAAHGAAAARVPDRGPEVPGAPHVRPGAAQRGALRESGLGGDQAGGLRAVESEGGVAGAERAGEGRRDAYGAAGLPLRVMGAHRMRAYTGALAPPPHHRS